MNEKRIDSDAAGYMELACAQKDGDCEIVDVAGGVSRDRGCCNLFKADNADTKLFSCGTCWYLEGHAGQTDELRPLGKKEAGRLSYEEILESERPAEERR